MQTILTKVLLMTLFSSLIFAYSTPTYSLNMSINQQTLRVGEPLILSLSLHYTHLEEYMIITPSLKDFSVKEIADTEVKDKNDEWINTIKYELTPKKSGHFLIPSQSANIEYLDKNYKGFNDRHKYLHKLTIDSNTLHLNILSLPDNITINGLYELSTKVDTYTIEKNRPIKYTIMLKGEGNLKSLDTIKLDIPHTTIYTQKSICRNGVITKTFDILSSQTFSIPALSLDYYNKIFQEVRTLKTEAYTIKYKNKEEQKQYPLPLLGVLLLLTLIMMFWFRTGRKKLDRLALLKKIHDKNIFFKKCVVFMGKDKNLDILIYKLETVETKEFKGLKKKILKKLHDISLFET